MGIILVSEGGLLNNRYIKQNPLIIDSFLETNDTPARFGDAGESYADSDFPDATQFVRNASPISVTETDGTAPDADFGDTVLYSAVAALGRFEINTISGTGGIQKSGASSADQVVVWVGAGNLARSRSPTFDSSGNMVLPGILNVGSSGSLVRLGVTINDGSSEGVSLRHDGTEAFLESLHSGTVWHNFTVRCNDFIVQGGGAGTDFRVTSAGILEAGSATTVLTTSVGLLRHQAIDPSIAGSGLSVSSGVLSVDAHAPAAHTIASHSDTGATGAELETLTNGNNADSLHTHAVGGAPVDWATPGTIGSGTPNTGAFTTLSSSGLATLNSVVITNGLTVSDGRNVFMSTETTPTTELLELVDVSAAHNFGNLKIRALRPGIIFEDQSTGQFHFRIGIDSNILKLSIDNDDDLSKGADGHFDDVIAFLVSPTGDFTIPVGDLQVTAGDFEIVAGFLELGAPVDKTITAGVITPTTTQVSVISESGPTDDLTTINATKNGRVLILHSKLGSIITVKHAAGNIQIEGATDFIMTDTDSLMLIYRVSLSRWVQIGKGDI